MHGSIRNRLEDLLGGKRKSVSETELTGHLASCSECSSELNTMKSQAELLQLLRPPQEMEPAAGFYARVLQRIEERTRRSIWATFIYSPLSSRIAYVSLTLALVLGSYVVASETRDGHLLTHNSLIAENTHFDPVVAGNASEQRDAVLQNFASH